MALKHCRKGDLLGNVQGPFQKRKISRLSLSILKALSGKGLSPILHYFTVISAQSHQPNR